MRTVIFAAISGAAYYFFGLKSGAAIFCGVYVVCLCVSYMFFDRFVYKEIGPAFGRQCYTEKKWWWVV